MVRNLVMLALLHSAIPIEPEDGRQKIKNVQNLLARHSPRGAAVVVTGRPVAVVSIRRPRMVRGPLRGKGGRTGSGMRTFWWELGGWRSKHEWEVRMRRVEMGGQRTATSWTSRSSRWTKVRVVPVHLQHHHLNLSLSNCVHC